MKHLEIQTLPVTIKVVEVGGRKMTKSVFSQIAFEQGIMSDRIACGWLAEKFEILGWVNYLPEKHNEEKLKLIWDRGFLGYPKVVRVGFADFKEVFDPEYTLKYYRPRNGDHFVSVLYVDKWSDENHYLARCIAYKGSIVQKYPQLFIAT